MLSQSELSIQRYTFLGITVDAITSRQLIDAAVAAVETGERNLVFGNHNLHSLHLFHKEESLREFYSHCHLTHIDGMSLIALGRMLGLPIERQHRTTYLDWIEAFLATAEARGWKVYVLSGTHESADALPGLLREKYPSLQIRSHHGFIRPNDDAAVLDDIHEFAPDILLVGMGMPRQEQWILKALPSLDTSLIFNCGAAFEYLVGAKYRPPRWAGQMGVEWLFRMFSEPRRLTGRYCIEPLHLVPLLWRAAMGRLSRYGKEMFCVSRIIQPSSEATVNRRAP